MLISVVRTPLDLKFRDSPEIFELFILKYLTHLTHRSTDKHRKVGRCFASACGRSSKWL